jgi:peptide/nickel transport system substrate-binding protein
VYDISTFPDGAVRIRLKKDDPGFLSKIWDTAIIPRSDGKDMDFYNHPVGSGPFRFKFREGNRKVVLEANKDYYAGRPFVDRIVFIYQADREKTWTRLLVGETDIAQEITPKNYKMMYQSKDKFYFDQYTLCFYTILLYNTYDPLFSDPKVRWALALAIDRWYIVEKILEGYGRVANGPMGVDSPYHNPNVKPVPYDPQKAMALLKEAGWSHDRKSRRLFKNGKPFEFTILVFKESQIEKKVASYIQLCLNDLGIRVKLQALPFEKLHSRYCRSTEFHAVLTELNGAYRNPEIIQWTWSPRAEGKSYAGCFKHTQVTRLLKKGLSEKNPEKQKDLFCKIDTLITSLQPGTFLFHKTAVDAMSKRFRLPHPFSLSHEGIHRLRHATLRHE